MKLLTFLHLIFQEENSL
jgi:hypothetical protein